MALIAAVVLASCEAAPTPSRLDQSPSTPASVAPSGMLSPSASPVARVSAPVLRRVPLPGDQLQSPFPEQLAVAGGAIWIEQATWPNRLLRLDALTGQLTATDLDVPVRLVTGDDGSLWTVGPYGGAPGPTSVTVAQVDVTNGTSRRVVETVPAEIAVGLGSLWLSTGAELQRLDPSTGRVLERRTVDLGEPQVACGAVWGSSDDALDSTLKRVDPVTGVVARFGASGPLMERRDGCWAWVAGGIERVWPRPPIVVPGPSPRFVWQEGSNAWLRPYGAFQRWDPSIGQGVGVTWLIDAGDINPIAKIGDDGRIVTAGGHVWLITASEAVEYDIPAE